MKLSDAYKVFSTWDKRGRYVFRKSDLEIVIDESGKTLDQTISRLVEAGVLQRVAQGVYLYSYSAHIGATTIEDIARNLRRGDFVFESLESALSQYGVISQIPISRITLMTTGRSGEFRTPYGIIEFTLTKAPISEIVENILDRPGHNLPIAKKDYAYKNLRSVRRNLDLVDLEELDAWN
jgi:hypothetical protein